MSVCKYLPFKDHLKKVGEIIMRRLAFAVFFSALIFGGCGQPPVSSSETKIVGGEEVPTSQNDLRALATVALTTEIGPADTASPLDAGHSFCSGTIISERVILTAAHCVQKFDPETREKLDEFHFENESDFLVHFGVQVARGGDWIRAERIVPHPDWSPAETLTPSPSRAPDDIAVIVLSESIPGSATVAELAPSTASLSDLSAHLVGFGVSKSRDENDTGTMRQVSVPVSGESNSAKRFTVGELFRGACAGDSGGPAYFEIDGRLQVAGATSTGAELFGMCLGMGNNYTDARFYGDWIEATVGEYM
jgi:secreted trypsin-like serine protease